MKKSLIFFVFGFLLSLSFVSFASAAYFPDVRSLSQSVVDSYVAVGEPILQALFGGYGGWSGYLLFERFLLFVLLLSLVYIILGRVYLFDGQKALKWIIAIVIPLMGIRYMNYEIIETLLAQYGILSVILSSILPLIIFFFFVHNLGSSYPILRKVGWLIFIGIYAGLWSTTGGDFQSTVFFWTVIAAVFLLIFDTRIELWIAAKEFAKREKWNINNKIAEINERIGKINDQIVKGTHPNPKDARQEMHELELQKKYLTRQL